MRFLLISYQISRTDKLISILWTVKLYFIDFILVWQLFFRFQMNMSRQNFRIKAKRETIKIWKIQKATIMSEMSICRPKAFIIGCLRNLVSIILHHPHSACCPKMSWKPFNFAASQLVCHYQASSFSYVFAALWNLLHRLSLCQLILHVLSQLFGDSIAIVTHCSPSNWSWQCLMAFLFSFEL